MLSKKLKEHFNAGSVHGCHCFKGPSSQRKGSKGDSNPVCKRTSLIQFKRNKLKLYILVRGN